MSSVFFKPIGTNMRRSLLAALGVLTASFFFVHFAFAQTTTVTLVSNFSQSESGALSGSGLTISQAFDTGSYVRRIESVKFNVNTAVSDSSTDTFTVELRNKSSTNAPGSTVYATFSANHDTIESTGDKTVTLATPYELETNTAYHIVFTYSGSGTLAIAKINNNHQTGLTGWSIDNWAYQKTNGTWNYVQPLNPLRIEIKGSKLPIQIDNDDYSTSEAEKEITATVNLQSPSDLQWALFDASGSDTCDSAGDSSLTFSGTYTSGTAIVFNSASDNGKKVCFKATSNSVDYYAASGTIGGITPPPIVVTDDDYTTYEAQKEITATVNAANPSALNWAYFNPGAGSCDATGASSLTFSGTYTSGTAVTVSSASSNGNAICFKVTSDSTDTYYEASGVIDGVGDQPIKLVSNLDLYDGGGFSILAAAGHTRAVSFTTGNGVYALTNLEFDVKTARSAGSLTSVSLKLQGVTGSNQPDGTTLATAFLDAAELETTGIKRVTFPATILDPNTKYVIVFDGVPSSVTQSSFMKTIRGNSGSMDDGSLPGWRTNPYWSASNSDPTVDLNEDDDGLIMNIEGHAVLGVEDDDYTVTERRKKIIPTVSDQYATPSNLNYAIFDPSIILDPGSEPCSNLLTFSSTYTSGTGVLIDSESDNGKKVCFRVTSDGETYYAASGEIGGIDTTAPVVGTVTLGTRIADGYINEDDNTNHRGNDLVTAQNTAADVFDTSLKVIGSSETCEPTLASPIHTTTMTIGISPQYQDGIFRGYDATGNSYGSLADATFTFNGNDYTIDQLNQIENDSLSLWLRLRDENGDHVDEKTLLAGYDLVLTVDDDLKQTGATGRALIDTFSNSSGTTNRIDLDLGIISIEMWLLQEGSTVTVSLQETDGYGDHRNATWNTDAPTDIPEIRDIDTDGEYKVCVKMIDTAGNIGYGASSSFTRDTTAPTITVGTMSSNSISATITGSTSARYIKVNSNSCTSSEITSSTGESYTPGTPILLSADDNSKYLCFRAEDAAGNVSYGISAEISGAVDQTHTIVLKASSDSGPSSSDGYTNDNTPTVTVSGYADDATDVTITAASTQHTNVTDSNNGNGDHTLSTLADGEWTLSATDGTDATNTITITVDTSAPSKPNIGLIHEDDTGHSSSDDITSETDLAIHHNTIGDGEAMEISNNGSVITSTSESDNQAITLAEGTHSLTAVHVDKAGNRSSTSDTLTIIVDTTDPSLTAQQNGNFMAATASDTNAVSIRYKKTDSTTCDNTVIADNTAETEYTGQVRLAEADNDDYVCFRAEDDAGNTVYVASSQIAGVVDFDITVTDDTDGSDPEQTKDLTVTLSETTGVTNTVWGIVDNTAACAATSDSSLTTAYTASTTGTTVTIAAEAANGKVVCFKATKGGSNYYQASGTIAGIDRTPPSYSMGVFEVNGTEITTPRAYVKLGDVISATLTINESVTATPTVTFANNEAATVTHDSANSNYDVSFTVANTTDEVSSLRYDISALTDLAGNTYDPPLLEINPRITVDRTAPTVSVPSLANDATDTYINSAESSNTNDLITVPTATDTNGNVALTYALIDNNGTCDDTVTVTGSMPQSDDPATDKEYQICIKGVDLAGNETYVTSPSFTRDTVSPTISSKTLSLSGQNDVDNIFWLNENDTITITMDANEDIKTQTIDINVTSGAGSSWNNVTSTQSNRTHTFLITIANGENTPADGDLIVNAASANDIVDLAGNAVTSFTDESFETLVSQKTVVDTTPPLAPADLDLHNDSDTCADFDGTTGCDFGANNDDITSHDTLVVSVTAELSADLNTKVNGTPNSVSPDVTNTRTHTPISLTTEGDNAVTMTQTDRAGNESPESEVLTITLDTTAPTAPPTPDLEASSDSGVSGTDNLTKRRSVVFDTGTHTFADECRFVYEGTFSAGSTHTCSGGLSFDADQDGSDESYDYVTFYPTDGEREQTFTMRSYDLAGNTSDSANTLNVRFDFTVPEATMALETADDSGYHNGDRITNVNQPRLSLNNLEFSTAPTGGTGTAKVVVYDWDDSDSDNDFLNGDETTELTAVYTANNVTATAMDNQQLSSTLGDGVRSLVLKQEDDAGNVTWTDTAKLTYNDQTGAKGDNIIIIDTTKPMAPGMPDLSPTTDTYGAHANYSRDGTNSDNLTKEHGLLFFSVAALRDVNASVDATGAALTRERHHITFYELSEATYTPGTTEALNASGSSVAAYSDGSTASYPNANADTANNRGVSSMVSGSAVTQFGYTDAVGTLSTHVFNKVGEDERGNVYYAARQYDAAGNVSDYSDVITVDIDRQAPDKNTIAADLILHSASDTGIDDDRRTANTTPVFTMRWPMGISPPNDIDYYELHRAKLDENFETIQAFAYPSNALTNDQASFDWVDPEEDASADPLNPEPPTSATADVYTNGVAIKMFRQDPPEVNQRYAFRIVAVDLAGNMTGGVDQSNPFFTVPPPTPTNLDLLASVDSGADSADNLTKETTWRISTQYKNTSTEEQEGQAAQNLRTLKFSITPPPGVLTRKTVTFTRPEDNSSGNGFTIPATEAANLDTTDYTDTYTFDGADIDLTTVFGTDDLPQGEYTVTITGVNAQHEEGTPSAELIVGLDTTAPQIGDTLTLLSDQYYDTGADIQKFRFTGTGEDGTIITLHHAGGTRDFTIVSGATEGNLSGQTVSDDYDYEISAIDYAGNTMDRLPYPVASKSPKTRAYMFDSDNDNTDDTYLVTAVSQNDGTLTYRQYRPASTVNPSCIPPASVNSYTSYTPQDLLTTQDLCIEAVDSHGNRTAVSLKGSASPLITASGLLTEDDRGDSTSDNRTNVANPRYTGTTVPGSSIRVLAKHSSESWSTAYEQTVTAGEDGVFTLPGILRSSAADAASFTNSTLSVGTATSGDLGYVAGDAGTLGTASFTSDGDTYTITTLSFASSGLTISLGSSYSANEVTSLLGDYTLTLSHNNVSYAIPLSGTGSAPAVTNGTNAMIVGTSADGPLHTALGTMFTDGNQITVSLTRDDVVDVRGYVTNAALTGGTESEIGPINLTTVTIDRHAPVISGLSFETPSSSPGNVDTPALTLRSEDGATAALYTDSACTEQTGSDITFSSTVIADLTADTLTDDGTYHYYAGVEDTAGNRSCSSPLLYTYDSISPTVIIIKSGTEYRAVADETATAQSLDSTAAASCSSSTTGTAYTPGASVTVSGDGRCFIFTDSAGNVAAAHTDDAIETAGGLTMTDGTTDGTTHHVRSGSRPMTAQSAPGASVQFYLDDGTADADSDNTLSATEMTDASLSPAATVTADQSGRIAGSLSVPSGTASLTIYAAIDIDSSGTYSSAVTIGSLVVDDEAPTLSGTLTVSSDNAVNTAYATDGNTIALSAIDASEPLRDISLTIAGTTFTNCATDGSNALTCDDLTVTTAATEGPATLTFSASDKAGNVLTLTEASGITIDYTAPIYSISAATNAARPGATVPVNVAITDANDIYLNGAAIDETNSLRVIIGSRNHDLTSFPATISHLVPDTAGAGTRFAALPPITDAAGNMTSGKTEYLFFVDINAPTITSFDFSTSGTTMTVSALIDRNNHASMAGDEGIHFIFTGSCSAFPASPIFTDDAQMDNVRYTYEIKIPRKTFEAQTCHLVAVDAVGNQQAESDTTQIYVPITGTRSGGGGGGGGGYTPIASFFSSGSSSDDSTTQDDPVVEQRVVVEQQPPAEQQTRTFTRNLGAGDIGDDVRRLQVFLNQNGFTIADTGPGSPGSETTYYGSLTTQAVARYQQANGIQPAVGSFGPITRAHVNSALAITGTTAGGATTEDDTTTTYVAPDPIPQPFVRSQRQRGSAPSFGPPNPNVYSYTQQIPSFPVPSELEAPLFTAPTPRVYSHTQQAPVEPEEEDEEPYQEPRQPSQPIPLWGAVGGPFTLQTTQPRAPFAPSL